MKTLIYGAGPIGRWLALKLQLAGKDVTLLARGDTRQALSRHGVQLVDAPTGQRLSARIRVVDRLDQADAYDLVVVAMARAPRLAVCPELARNQNLQNILLVGNDFSGAQGAQEHLPRERMLLGFPGAGGGWDGEDLVVMDRDRSSGRGEFYLGELDGRTRRRTVRIRELLEAAGLKVHVEPDMDGWLKYHFAFIAPTAGVIFEKHGDLAAVATDADAIHRYCLACREAGNVLRAAGHHRRQPGVFNLYYWVPRWLEPWVFCRLFSSEAARVRFGLHARTVGPELLQMAAEFTPLRASTGLETPTLDALLAAVPGAGPSELEREVA